jgi:hypothetical protein
MQNPALSDWRESARTPEMRGGCRSGVVAIAPEDDPAIRNPDLIEAGMGALRRSRNWADAAKHG